VLNLPKHRTALHTPIDAPLLYLLGPFRGILVDRIRYLHPVLARESGDNHYPAVRLTQIKNLLHYGILQSDRYRTIRVGAVSGC
jgi:hypothetical protein